MNHIAIKHRVSPYAFPGLYYETVGNVRRAFSSQFRETVEYRRSTIDKVFLAVYKITYITREQIESKTRVRDVVDARQLTHFFLRKYLKNSSFHAIGEITGGNNYSSVIHSINQVEDLVATDKRYRNIYELIEEELKSLMRINK